MKKLLLTLFLNICIFNLFCQTVSDNESQSKGKDVQIAIGETFAVNVLFNLADKYMLPGLLKSASILPVSYDKCQ